MYAAVADMISAFKERELIQLTDEARLGVIDETKVESALADASMLAESYVGKQYDLTAINPVPRILTKYTCDVARYNLFGDAVPEAVQARYDAAITWLKDLARGIVRLDIAGVEPASEPATIEVACSVIADGRDRLRGL